MSRDVYSGSTMYHLLYIVYQDIYFTIYQKYFCK